MHSNVSKQVGIQGLAVYPSNIGGVQLHMGFWHAHMPTQRTAQSDICAGREKLKMV